MNLTPAEQEMLAIMHESSRLAHVMVREFSADYRQAIDNLKSRQARNGWSDLVYRNIKNQDINVADALSRWHWWADEANRIDAEIQIELGLLAAIEDPAARPQPDLWGFREQLEAHREAVRGRRHDRARRQARQQAALRPRQTA